MLQIAFQLSYAFHISRSFAAVEGAIGLARSENMARKIPLRVILNGSGKDAAQIIGRINGFTHVETALDYATGKVSAVKENPVIPPSGSRHHFKFV